ncbi:MAG TPA: hypothetical protein VHL10_00920 [Nitrososphaera sp.]|nr:hypothetical protein [Nitrososphaera sp.]
MTGNFFSGQFFGGGFFGSIAAEEVPAGGTSKRKKRHKKPLTWAEGLQLAQKKLKEQALASAVEKIEEKQVLEASALAEDEEEDDDIITAIIISRSLH